MSDIWVIHSSNHYIVRAVECGSGAHALVLKNLMGGHYEGRIDRIDRYNVEEHTADDVTEDIACELARLVRESGDEPHAQVRDLIESELGVGTAIPAIS